MVRKKSSLNDGNEQDFIQTTLEGHPDREGREVLGEQA